MLSTRGVRRWASIAITAILFSSMVAAEPSIATDYCSSVNTANMEPFLSDFQSQGRCTGNCTDIGAALAIVQWKSCWCSDLVPNPADQKSLSSCQDACPGYPDDYCGSRGSGGSNFGYMKLKSPSGTAAPGVTNTKTGGAAHQWTQIVKQSLGPQADVTTKTEIVHVTPLPSVEPDPELGEPTTTRGTPTSPAVQTVTVGGSVQTVTAVPDPNPSGTQSQLERSGKGGLSTGATAGIAVGVVVVFAAAAILLFLYCLKRKRSEGEKGFVASRRGSPNSSGGAGVGDVSEVRFGDASTLGGWEGSAANSHRRSHLMPVDPRAEFAKQNKSQVSIGSLQDNFDYTRPINEVRVLKAMNPDPDP